MPDPAPPARCRYCGLPIQHAHGFGMVHTVSGDRRCSLYATPVSAWGGHR